MSTLKKTAPDFRVGFVVMLFSMIMLCMPKTDAAIVDGDFETNRVAGSPFPAPDTSLLPSWLPTNALYGTNSNFGTTVLGIDPAFYNSVFRSVASDGTPGGSISAVFATSPVGNRISMGSISQNVSTTPGKFYDIRLWVANLPTGNGAGPDLGARENLFSLNWGGNATPIDLSLWNANFAAPNPSNPTELSNAPAGAYVLTATGGWTLLLITNQPASTGATTSLTISAQNNNLATAVDFVEVTETPEPSSIVLLAAGAALAGLRRRRQQRAA